MAMCYMAMITALWQWAMCCGAIFFVTMAKVWQCIRAMFVKLLCGNVFCGNVLCAMANLTAWNEADVREIQKLGATIYAEPNRGFGSSSFSNG